MKSSSSVELAGSIRMGTGVYDHNQLPIFHNHHHHQINNHNLMWENTLKGDLINITPTSFTSSSTIVHHHQQQQIIEQEDDHRREIKPADHNHQYNTTPSEDALENLEIHEEPNRPFNRVERRQAQNRAAARKCRLRKKAYVQQLETCRLKLTQMEQELERTRRQASYGGGANTSGLSSLTINPGIATFEMEYKYWVDEQKRQYQELRNLLQVQVGEEELGVFVENALNHYYKLFRMKVDVANIDVFFLISGTWRTPIEQFFIWIGGFRPSELLNIIVPQLDQLTEQQILQIRRLRQSSIQAEDALSQGMDRLQQSLGQNIAVDSSDVENYRSQMTLAIEKLDALENFVNQADHLRQQTLVQMSRILTNRHAAQGLVALGDYFQRLRTLSSLWAARPRTT
ncbi:transcription factor TGA7-like [Impatiens glandulifera]|uniref:transcription factor TGA7-like n=1 Tax=Impatiens glandulifera TaxID=253017 RepID=UPI001FB199E3|nr:transcription factor TGA7-like [Impatiens glandulifera]